MKPSEMYEDKGGVVFYVIVRLNINKMEKVDAYFPSKFNYLAHILLDLKIEDKEDKETTIKGVT